MTKEKLYRVVATLEDGRKVYTRSLGEVFTITRRKWNALIKDDTHVWGYTADLEIHTYKEILDYLGKPWVKVTRFDLERADLPLNPKIH